MQYKIYNVPVWDAYRGDGCPLCAIRAKLESRLVSDYLAQNVMDPDFRTRSNAVGFCPEHITMMYAGVNKLGLALQLETRAHFLRELLSKSPSDKKSAKKTAENIDRHYGCVICAALDEPMPRYAMTVAQMFDNEPEFIELFTEANHCVKHAQMLYTYSEYAGKSTSKFLVRLTEGLRRDLKKTEESLRRFADCFDFNNAGARPDPATIPNAIKLLITDKIK